LCGKSIGLVISDCGFRIFWIFFFNPHSAIGIPQFGGGPVGDPPDRPYTDSTRRRGSGAVPARPKKWNAPHDFSTQRPCFLAGQSLKFNRSDANLTKSEGGEPPPIIDSSDEFG